ncbi:Glyoxylate reductase [Tritrichomonas foetus]|uniref:Glyoxylate reductase n=1 Tax=Tritrichomonas foetus TaxID=1144522 RepID=A0A1J4L322_9EUKA|nr:Glyoxylate reductase [Tritrichomonas foetus]|eukprot:OHT17480.1 Glyoxylate reductase [Tritrichomonas foetus]
MTKLFSTVDIPEPYNKLLFEHFPDAEIWPGTKKITSEILYEKAKTANYLLVVPMNEIDDKIYDLPNIKIISSLSTGIENINLKRATEKKIIVCHTPEAPTTSTADLTVGLLISAARHIVASSEYVKNKEFLFFDPFRFYGLDVSDTTVGIIGPGRIGSAVAKRLSGFDCNFLYYGNRNQPKIDELGGKLVPLNELLSSSDFVVITCPLNDTTRGMIGEEQFKLMKKTAILVNTGRGAIVKTDDLLYALQNKIIAGAALDVTDPEPLPVDHPLISLPNCIITSHLGAGAEGAKKAIFSTAVQAVIDFENGKRPLYPANPTVFD